MVKRNLLLSLALLSALPARAAFDLSEADFLADLPTVLTSSRLAQPLMDAPNSTNVISRKEIEASGYHNLSDLFRLIPGMYVGQKKGWFHNVTHTFADEFARRMQVMVDGRSIYLPTIGGVRWDTLPLAIDDIERIEVVRGPNAASFGANAFTGIINIITRHPDDVAGRMLHLIGGEHDHRETWFRWAGRSEQASHRVTLGERRDGGMRYQYDDELSRIMNYRGEFSVAADANLSIQLGILAGERGDGHPVDTSNQPHEQKVDSQYFQADYHVDLSPGRSLQTKLAFNHLRTNEDIPTLLVPGSYYESDLLAQRWHLETQLNSLFSDDLRSALGAYLRRDSVQSELFWNTSEKLHVDSHGLFGHLEWRLSKSWLINAGAFWEDYELVGGKLSPRATLHWQPNPRHAFRAGISKAYRNPVLFETDGDQRVRLLAADGSLILALRPFILASGNLQPESIVSREIAYLGQWPEQDFTLDIRVFRERIADYISALCKTGNDNDCKISQNPLTFLPRDWVNEGGALQQGYEIQGKWQPAADSMLMFNHAHLDIDTHLKESRYSPPHISGVHLMHRFPGRIDLSLSHYWVAGFKAIGQGAIPSYKRLDARLGKKFEINKLRGVVALTWQNLSGSYQDFDDNSPDNLFDSRTSLHFMLEF